MSDGVRRYLGSRKNIAGMAGALAGVGLHLAGVIGDVWPVVAVGLYGVGALVGPSDPRTEAEPRLTDALRSEAAALLQRVQGRAGRLVAQVPDVHARRAEDLTREMRRRERGP